MLPNTKAKGEKIISINLEVIKLLKYESKNEKKGKVKEVSSEVN